MLRARFEISVCRSERSQRERKRPVGVSCKKKKEKGREQFTWRRDGEELNWLPRGTLHRKREKQVEKQYKSAERTKRGEETHVQRQIQAYHITRPQQLLKPHISGATGKIRIELLPIVVLHPHAQCLGLPFQIPPYSPHANNPQQFILRVMAKRRRWVSTPRALTQGAQGGVERAQSTKKQEYCRISCSGVDGCGYIGDVNPGGGAG